MGDLTINPASYPKYTRQLNQADAAGNGNGVVDTPEELKIAAKAITGKSDIKALQTALGITSVAGVAAKGASKGATITGIKDAWGKGIKMSVQGNQAIIEGKLLDSAAPVIDFSPIHAKAGQTLKFDVETEGQFVWGGKILSLSMDETWEVFSGKKTISIPIKRDKDVDSIAFKTGAMSGAIIISNIRVQ